MAYTDSYVAAAADVVAAAAAASKREDRTRRGRRGSVERSRGGLPESASRASRKRFHPAGGDQQAGLSALSGSFKRRCTLGGSASSRRDGVEALLAGIAETPERYRTMAELEALWEVADELTPASRHTLAGHPYMPARAYTELQHTVFFMRIDEDRLPGGLQQLDSRSIKPYMGCKPPPDLPSSERRFCYHKSGRTWGRRARSGKHFFVHAPVIIYKSPKKDGIKVGEARLTVRCGSAVADDVYVVNEALVMLEIRPRRPLPPLPKTRGNRSAAAAASARASRSARSSSRRHRRSLGAGTSSPAAPAAAASPAAASTAGVMGAAFVLGLPPLAAAGDAHALPGLRMPMPPPLPFMRTDAEGAVAAAAAAVEAAAAASDAATDALLLPLGLGLPSACTRLDAASFTAGTADLESSLRSEAASRQEVAWADLSSDGSVDGDDDDDGTSLAGEMAELEGDADAWSLAALAALESGQAAADEDVAGDDMLEALLLSDPALFARLAAWE
eukprot:PLAT13668.1.p1 GENE.PLAT13668.1~~PLAT13668.1.p1  ORF type:complete len:532 (+),score=198.96 PLAT13668.1:86-1597(+)